MRAFLVTAHPESSKSALPAELSQHGLMVARNDDQAVTAVGAFADENGSPSSRMPLANLQPGGFPLRRALPPDCGALIPIESCA
jgi:hypothetical protein